MLDHSVQTDRINLSNNTFLFVNVWFGRYPKLMKIKAFVKAKFVISWNR